MSTKAPINGYPGPESTQTITDPTFTGIVPNQVDEFVTLRPAFMADLAKQCEERSLEGTEVFMNDIRPRTLVLADDEDGTARLIESLAASKVRRVHASYWASPTSFLTNVNFSELVGRFGDIERMHEYYGDMSGRHIFTRWVDEYALARSLGARAFVFHLIDYHPVDGAWSFTISRNTVLQAMAAITQQFLRELDERGMLDAGAPVIELENAGWGLEFGAQTADDFVVIFESVWDPHDLLRIGWDINHLLHAIGLRDGKGVFQLPDEEITPEMARIETASNGDIDALAKQWVEANVLDPRIERKVCAIHLSDCAPKSDEFFRNGELTPRHAIEGTWDERRAKGLALVLEHYDNHLPLGDGMLTPSSIRRIIESLARRQPLMLLHELKNTKDLWADVDRQRLRLWGRPTTSTSTLTTQRANVGNHLNSSKEENHAAS